VPPPPTLQPSTAPLDTALSGLHLDPAAKPGAGLLAAGGDSAAVATPLPPKSAALPQGLAGPPPASATAPPALGGGRPLTRRAVAAAASTTSSSSEPGSSVSEAGEAPGLAAAAVPGVTAAEAAVQKPPAPPPPPGRDPKAAIGPPPPPKVTRAATATGATPTATISTVALPPPRPPPTSRLCSAPPAAPSPGDLAVGLVYDPAMEAHTPPGQHVERPARLSVLAGLLASRGLAARCHPLAPRRALDEELVRAHSPAHIASVDGGYAAAVADGGGLERGDMFYSPGTANAARLAAGSVTNAVLAVLSGEVSRAFAVVRPPGHHATCARAMGFCFFNNCVVAAAAARAVGGAKRVLIVDWCVSFEKRERARRTQAAFPHTHTPFPLFFSPSPRDVHHGNGVADLVDAANAADVAAGLAAGLMYVSLHRGAGFYPGTGQAVEVGVQGAKGTTLNVAWPRGGMGDAEYAAAFDLVVMPAAKAFNPDLVIIAAGFDAAAGDPLGGCTATPAGFAFMASRLCSLAGGKVVAALEGGYNTRVTAACAAAVVEVLLQGGAPGGDAGGGDAPPPAGRPTREAAPAIEAAATAHAPHCPALRPLVGEGEGGFGKAWAAYSAAAQAPRTLRSRGGGGGAAAAVA